MNYYGIILAFILCMSFTSFVHNEKDIALEKRCFELDKKPLTHLCTFRYPRLAKIRYGDNMVMTGMKYSVYLVGESGTDYFISHGRSELNNCKTLTIQNQISFTCDKQKLVDTLVSNCTNQQMSPSKFVAMHYVDSKRTFPAEVVTNDDNQH